MQRSSRNGRKAIVIIALVVLAFWVPGRAEAGPEMSLGGPGEDFCSPAPAVGAVALSGLAFSPSALVFLSSNSRVAASVGGGLGYRTGHLTMGTLEGPENLTTAEASRRRRRRRSVVGAARFGAEFRATIAPEKSLDFVSRWNNRSTWSKCAEWETYSSVTDSLEISLTRAGNSEFFLEVGPALALLASSKGHRRSLLMGPGLVLGSGVRSSRFGPSFLARGGLKLEYMTNGGQPIYRFYSEVGFGIQRPSFDWEFTIRANQSHARTTYSDHEWVGRPLATANVGLAK